MQKRKKTQRVARTVIGFTANERRGKTRVGSTPTLSANMEGTSMVIIRFEICGGVTAYRVRFPDLPPDAKADRAQGH